MKLKLNQTNCVLAKLRHYVNPVYLTISYYYLYINPIYMSSFESKLGFGCQLWGETQI